MKSILPSNRVAAYAILALNCAFAGCAHSEPVFPSDDAFLAVTAELRRAKPLPMEAVGVSPARAWVTPIDLHKNKAGNWIQLLAYKADHHASNSTVYILALDLETGKVKPIGDVPGIQIPVGAKRWLNGKLYFTNQNTQKPGRLYSYDPEEQTVKDLAAVSENAGGAWKISALDDGTISLAGADMTLALYDTNTGKMKTYGKMGEDHNYIYYVSHDKDWLYISLRGKVPWQARAVNRKTGEQRLLLTAPVDSHVDIGGNLSVIPREGTRQYYKLQDGTATPYDPTKEPTVRAAAAIVKETPPQISLDEITGHIKWQNPRNKQEWKEADLPVAMSPGGVAYAVRLKDGRMAAMAPAYLPMVIFDPADDAKPEAQRKPPLQVPLGEISARSMLVDGNSIFIAGYPSGVIMRFEADKPVVSGGLGEAATNPTDNPRFLYRYSKDLEGAHIASSLTPDDQGNAWLIGRRHRYYRGFGLAWFNLKTEERGIFNDGGQFDQNQISWMTQLDGGKGLALATCVQANDQRPGKPGTSGKVFIVDTHEKKITHTYEPMPGYDVLLGIAQTNADHIVGAAYKTTDMNKAVFYRLNIKTGETEQIAPGGRHGVPNDSGLPGKGNDFVMGPDGYVWTAVEIGAQAMSLIRINPEDLSVKVVCLLTGGNIRMLFEGDDLLLTSTVTPDGDTRIHRLRRVIAKPRA